MNEDKKTVMVDDQFRAVNAHADKTLSIMMKF